MGGRDTYLSNKGSEVMIGEAIRNIQNDQIY